MKEKKKGDLVMVTLTFILIAYLIRGRFLPEEATRGDKVLYYAASIVMTPIFGPWFFKILIESKSSDRHEPGSHVFPNIV